MTKLSVNVNKLATLRNSRGKNNPDVLKTSLDIIRFGAEGITVHPRPDGRHIRSEDVYALKRAIGVEFNMEGYPSEDFLKMVEEVRPAQCTLVPDPPHVLTSNAGWRVEQNEKLLKSVSDRLRAKDVRISVFIDPNTIADHEFALLQKIGVHRVELYTEAFAEHFGKPKAKETTARYKRTAELALRAGLGVNAGHDLDLKNLAGLIEAIPWTAEVSIGHALICDALYFGLEETVRRYLDCIRVGTEAARVSSR